VGLGSHGSAALFHLARLGVRVLGLDTFTPPHTRGSHHGDTRITRMAYMEARTVGHMAQHSDSSSSPLCALLTAAGRTACLMCY
jgi:sarcosine oxidase